MPHRPSSDRPRGGCRLPLVLPRGPPGATEFEVTYTPEVRPGPVSARVYVMLGAVGKVPPARAHGPSRGSGPDWFRPQPFFAVDVEGLEARRAARDRGRGRRLPRPLDDARARRLLAQAVVRLNPDTHKLGDGEGNAYGPVVHVRIELDAETGGPIRLKVDTIVPRRQFQETDRIKLVELPSPILSAFHHRPIKHRAAVILPEGDPTSRQRPTLYIIPGFGGDHYHGDGGDRGERPVRLRQGLDPRRARPRLRHRPPRLRRLGATTARAARRWSRSSSRTSRRPSPPIAEPRARLLNGHSSGGWSSLWLQVDLPRRLRRHLVHQPRPGRFPRLPADQPLRARREHVPRPRREPPADRADGDRRRARSTTASRRWRT